MNEKQGAVSRPVSDPLFVEEIDFPSAVEEFFEGGCTPEQEKKCAASSGAFLSEVCKTCGKKDWRPHIYIAALYHIHVLQTAGMAFESDLFDIQFWWDLGHLKMAIEARRFRI